MPKQHVRSSFDNVLFDSAHTDQNIGFCPGLQDRQEIARERLPVEQDLPDAVLYAIGILHADRIVCAAVTAGDREAFAGGRDAWIDLQTVECGLDAENGL